jgi:hypothetical protein
MRIKRKPEPVHGSDSSPPPRPRLRGVFRRINRALLAWGRWMDGHGTHEADAASTEAILDPTGHVRSASRRR